VNELEVTSAPVTPPVRWGLGQWWAGIGLLVALSLVAGISLLAYWVASGALDLTGTEAEVNDRFLALAMAPAGLAILFAAQWAGPVASMWWASYKRGQHSWAKDFGLVLRWRDVPLGVAVALAARGVEYLLGLVLDALGSDALAQAENAGYLNGTSAWGLVVLALLVVVLGPLVEELFFRGLLLRSLLKRKPDRRLRKLSAVLITSVVFGLAHVGNVEGGALGVLTIFIITGTLGAVMGTMALKSGRLGPSLVTHVTYNGFAVLLVALGAGA
jgi:membrane protease YdiL (CAAX protease family)